jgi:acetyl esterase/lipase
VIELKRTPLAEAFPNKDCDTLSHPSLRGYCGPGGGFVMGTLDSQDALAHRSALESNSVVVSVDYSLAPERPFPEGVNDSFVVYEWIHQNGDVLGAHPAQLGVWGEHAGATVAAAVALMARDRQVAPAAQFLAYPALCSTLNTQAWNTLGTDYWRGSRGSICKVRNSARRRMPSRCRQSR